MRQTKIHFWSHFARANRGERRLIEQGREEEEEEEGEGEGEEREEFQVWIYVSFGCLGFWHEFSMEISCSLF